MIKTLLTESEVISWTKLGKEFPGCTFNDIKQVELTERRERLGKDFYDSMVASLADHEYDPYASGVSYTAGDKVLYDGLIYEANEDTSQEPVISTDWDLAAKFSNADLNNLWVEVLGRYLSLRVLQSTIPHLEVKVSGSGLVELDGATFNAPTPRSGHNPIKRMQEWLETQASAAWKNLEDYLVDNKAKTAFADFLGFQKQDDCEEGTTTIFPEPEDSESKPKKTEPNAGLNGYQFL